MGSDRFCIVRSDRQRNRFSIVDFLLNSPKEKKESKKQRNSFVCKTNYFFISCFNFCLFPEFHSDHHFHNRDNNSEFANYATRGDQDVGSDLADRKIDALYRYRVRSKWGRCSFEFSQPKPSREMLGNSGFFVFFFSPCRA